MFAFFINRKLLVNIMVILFITAGFIALRNTPREGMPAIDLNQLSIVTRYPGASPEDVELNVTFKIEEQLQEVDGLVEITSVSIENSSSIMVQIDESLGKSRMGEIKDDVQKAIDSIDDLPEEIEDRPLVTEMKTSDIPVIEIALSHKNKEYLREIAIKLEKKIEKSKGVAGVDKIGYFDREIHIEVDPGEMKKAFVSLPEIVSSIQKRNLRSTSGTMESYQGLKNIVILNKFKNPLDVENVILRSNFDFKNIKLKEISQVKMSEKDNHLIIRNNGQYGMSLVVRKKNNADIIRTISRIKSLIKKDTFNNLTVAFINDQSKTTRTRLRLLISNGLIGFILVLILLFVFLNPKAAFWTSFGIPFCFIAAFSFFPLFNITISAIALGGLIVVLGIIVDDAIVISEKIATYQEKGIEPKKASLMALKEMSGPITAASITTICAYVPLFFLGGRPGKFIWAIPAIVIIIILISLFECFLVLPNHLSHGKNKIKQKPLWLITIENYYRKLLNKFIKARYFFLVFFTAILISMLILAKSHLKFQMFPQSGIDTFYIRVEGNKEQSITNTEKTVIQIEKVIDSLPEKELLAYTSRIGHHSTSKTKNFGDHENWAIISVFLTSDTKRDRTAGMIIKELRKKIKSPPGTKIIFDKKKIGPINKKPITLHVISNDNDLRANAEEKIISFLSKMKKMGVSDIDSDQKEGKDELVVNLNHRKMASLGISTADVAQTLKIAFDGIIVTSIRTVEEEIEYRLILNKQSRKNEKVINSLGIKNKEGALISLKSFTNYTTRKADLAVYHRNGIRSTTITAEVNPKKITALESAEYIKTNLLAQWKKPDNLEIVIGGEVQDTKEIMGGIKIAIILSLLLIFCTIAIMLDSLTQPLLIMSIIPFEVIGIITALFLHGQNISMFVLLALVSLSGIVVNDSIVMVDTLNKALKNRVAKARNKSEFYEFISLNAKSRLRPILLTTLTTLAGLIPMAYGWGGYEKMLSPMSLAFSWGLMFATIITLFMIPSLYVILEDFKGKK